MCLLKKKLWYQSIQFSCLSPSCVSQARALGDPILPHTVISDKLFEVCQQHLECFQRASNVERIARK